MMIFSFSRTTMAILLVINNTNKAKAARRNLAIAAPQVTRLGPLAGDINILIVRIKHTSDTAMV